MAKTVAATAPRTEANPVRSRLDAIRAVSHVARMTAKPSLAREAFRAAQAALGRSQKELALNAEVSQSVLSEALNGSSRHLDADWILRQDDTFVLAWWHHVEQAKGLTRRTRKRVRVQRIAELFQLLLEEDDDKEAA